MTGKFVPPEKPDFLRYVRIPEEGLEMLSKMSSRAHYDRLCGAIVRFTMSGEAEDVPKCIEPQYAGLKPIIKRIRQGGMNQKGSNTDVGHNENEAGSGAEHDENASGFDAERDANPWDISTETEARTQAKTEFGFEGAASPLPAETPESVANQPKCQPNNPPCGNPWDLPTSNPVFESESVSACEKKDYDSLKTKENVTENGKLTDEEKLKLRTETNKLIGCFRCEEREAKKLVYDEYQQNGIDGVKKMVAGMIRDHAGDGGRHA